MMTLLQGPGLLDGGLAGSTEDSDHDLPIHDDRAMVWCLWHSRMNGLKNREGWWGEKSCLMPCRREAEWEEGNRPGMEFDRMF